MTLTILLIFLLLCPRTQCLEPKRNDLERVDSLRVRPCVSSFPTVRGSYTDLPKPRDLSWCIDLKTDKTPRDYHLVKRHSRAFHPKLGVTWTEANRNNQQLTCEFGLKGYRESYALSPDYGAHTRPGCQSKLEELKTNLEEISGPRIISVGKTFNVESESCHFLHLPLDSRSHRICTDIKPNTWYLIRIQTSYTRESLTKGIDRGNETYYRLFHTTLAQGFDDPDLIQSFVQLKLHFQGCTGRLLLNPRRNLSRHLLIESTLLRNNSRPYADLEAVTFNSSTATWEQIEFVLSPKDSDGPAKICLRAKTAGFDGKYYPLTRKRQCFPVDRSQCSSGSNRESMVPSAFVTLALTFLSAVIFR